MNQPKPFTSLLNLSFKKPGIDTLMRLQPCNFGIQKVNPRMELMDSLADIHITFHSQ